MRDKLPSRWRLHHGAYYYQVPPGNEPAWDGKASFRLGKTLPEAFRTWADRVETKRPVKTIAELLDRYLIEVVPTKAPATQTGNRAFIKPLRATFGAMPLLPFEPQLIYQYYTARSAKTSARREIEVLRHAYTMAVQWGLIPRHPFKGEVELPGSASRNRYVEDWELIECLSMKAKGGALMVQAYLKVKLLTGLRRSDLLNLKMSQITEDGIAVTPSKTKNSTGKKVVIEWSEALRIAVEDAKQARRVHLSPWLFANGLGECYWKEDKGDAPLWNKLWQSFMARALKETKLTERFTEHDIRAKCASDADTLAHACALLAHADPRTTERIYRRKTERIKPLR